MPGLGIVALACLAVLLDAGASPAGMPPPFPAGLAGPQLSAFSCSVKVPEPDPADLTSLAKITADKAIAAALAAYPGSRVRRLALENENGCLVYRVLLSNGLEVKVDAGNGQVLQVEPENDEDNDNQEAEVQAKKRKAR